MVLVFIYFLNNTYELYMKSVQILCKWPLCIKIINDYHIHVQTYFKTLKHHVTFEA